MSYIVRNGFKLQLIYVAEKVTVSFISREKYLPNSSIVFESSL